MCDQLCVRNWCHHQYMRWHESLWSSSALHMQIETPSGTITSVLWKIAMWVGRGKASNKNIFLRKK